MSVLSVFTYLFEADTSKVSEGLADGDKKAVALEKDLSKVDSAAVKLADNFKVLAASVISLGAAAFSWSAISAMAQASAEQTNALEANARALRMDADTLDYWTRANERAGGSAGEFHATLKRIQENLGPGADPIRALERVADRFKGLSDLQADRLGERLGLDKGTIELMRGGATGLDELIKRQQRLGMVTKEQTEAARNYRMQLHDTNQVQDDIRRRIATAVLPSMTQWLKMLENIYVWMRDKKEFVLAFFGGIAAVLTAAFLPALVRATVATWAFIAPWAGIVALVTAVAAAFALVVDDIMAFREGGRSMIGEISKNWPVVGVIVNEICDALGLMADIGRAAGGLLADAAMRPSQALDNFTKKIDVIVAKFRNDFPYFAAVFDGIGKAGAAAGETIMAAWKLVWAVISPIINAIRSSAEGVLQIANGVKGLFTGGPSAPTPSIGDARAPSSVPPAATVPPKPSSAQQLQIPATTPNVPAPKYLQIPTVQPAPVVKPTDVAKPAAAPTPAKVPDTPAAATAQTVSAAKAVTSVAASHPMANSMMSSTTNNSARNVEINTGPITVQTQATDADGVAKALGKSLQEQMRSANDEFDDGIVS